LVVLFGEMPMYLDQIQDALDDCQIFAAIGTSGVVRPACDFVDIASTTDTHWFNTEENMFSYAEQHLGPASVTVPAWVDELLRHQ
jgi:NAD-dependent deacetylase